MNFTQFALFMLVSLIATLPVIYGRYSSGTERQDRLALFQAVLGPVAISFGLFNLLNNVGMQGIIGTLIFSVEFLIGFLMTCSMLSRYFIHRRDLAGAAKIRAQVNKYQAPLGVFGIALGALWLSQGL